MRISKLLNKKYFSILIILFSVNSYADETVDIWNIEKKDPKESLNETTNTESSSDVIQNNEPSIYDMQSRRKRLLN